jgi:hypothetical protein
MQWLAAPILLAASVAVAWFLNRTRPAGPILPVLMSLGWIAIVLIDGGSLPAAAVGIVALLPLLGGRGVGTASLRLAGIAAAILLLAVAHADLFATGPGIAMFAAVAAAMLLFVVRGAETNKAPGIEAAHLAIVAIGIVVLAVDARHWGMPVNLPALIAGLLIGTLLATRPVGSAALSDPAADGTAILVATLLGITALQGDWAPAAILASIAALEITIWLVTAARADRSNDADRPRGVFVEAMARKREPRQILAGTAVAGIVVIVLALGAAQGEWIAGLIGAPALMWLLQRYLWRLLPQKRRY